VLSGDMWKRLFVSLANTHARARAFLYFSRPVNSAATRKKMSRNEPFF
jgi:hypothetical protein